MTEIIITEISEDEFDLWKEKKNWKELTEKEKKEALKTRAEDRAFKHAEQMQRNLTHWINREVWRIIYPNNSTNKPYIMS